MEQINLELEPGYLDRFQTIEDTVVHVVYSGRKAQGSIALDLDESPSALTRKVKGDLDFPLKHLPALMETTGDLTPLYWLVERFLTPERGEREQALRKALACVAGYPEVANVLQAMIDASRPQVVAVK